MSEDALTWNVFVALADAGKLRETVAFLTGKKVRQDPVLYLWGERIDTHGGRRERFRPLDEVHAALERDIRRFKTEPDAMLVAEGELLVCIEAKFGSGNPLAHAGAVAEGEKPVEREQLLRRYLDRASERTRRAFIRDGDAPRFHSQLFRNLVFASEMANTGDWHVVSLMSDTQRGRRAGSTEYSYEDPSLDVAGLLTSAARTAFSFRSWEGLHAALVAGDLALQALDQTCGGKARDTWPRSGSISAFPDRSNG